MGALLTLPITLLNYLLPFTKPGTPLLQDLVHTAILCGTLYYAPQIAERYQHQHHQQYQDEASSHGVATEAGENNDTRHPGQQRQARDTEAAYDEEEDENLPLDDRLVLQPEDDDETDPPPFAPTPPHAQNLQAPPLPQAHIHDGFPGAFDGQQQHQPGPAANAQAGPRATPANRTIGAKKAKSLARKDQRRAYHEFHRQEAELRRLQEAEGAEEREAAAAAERERRTRITEEIVRKEREEREARKRESEREAEEENERRERVVGRVREEIVTRGAVDLVDEAWKEGKDRVWVERLVKASGLLGQLQKEGQRVMITADGWLVKVDAEIMAQAYAEAEALGNANGGKVSFQELGKFMEKAVLARIQA